MQRLFHSPTALLLRRIALLYIVLTLCRVVFYVYNATQLGALTWSEIGPLFAGTLLFDTSSVVYASGLFILFSLLPLPIRERRWYRTALFWYYMVVNSVLIVAANLADCVYFRYTQKRLTADEILFADNDNSVQLIGKFLVENWYLGIIGIALIALLGWGYGRKTQEESIFSRGAAYYVGNTLIFAAAIGLCVAGIRGGVTRATRPITLSNATLYTTDSGKANLILSNPFCILRTVGNAGGVRFTEYFSAEELSKRFSPTHIPAFAVPDSLAVHSDSLPAPLSERVLKGRNIVLFVMESMSAEHSAYLMPGVYADRDTKGFTPFLDSLMRNGLTFKQMYANGTRSIQALPSILGSIPSFRVPFVLMPQSLGASRQLPAILASKGYTTAFLCGSEHGSMGFGAYARSAGVERLISREEYEQAHGTDDFDGYWGIWDEPFLQFAGEEFSQMPQPFFAALFTLSSHHPFVVPDKYAHTLPKGYTAIHRSVAYTDNAFRLFFERYKNEEWFTRTIFVFVADHVSSEKFAPQTRAYPGSNHIMGFIYTPDGVLQGQIDQTTQQLDIMPTILGLLGNEEPYFAFGRDILREQERPRWAISYDGSYRAFTGEEELRVEDQEQEKAADSLAQTLQALIQQYYTHAQSKSYLPND